MKKDIECVECEKLYCENEIEFVESDGCYVCDDCLRKKYTLCDDCGEYHIDENTSYIDSYDVYVCDYCEENNFNCCDICCGIFRKDSLKNIDGDYYCTHCELL